MNERVRNHFDEIEARLIECPVILSYEITRRDISPDDGKLRIKSALTGGGVFECFLYVKDTGYRIHPLKYSFHRSFKNWLHEQIQSFSSEVVVPESTIWSPVKIRPVRLTPTLPGAAE